MMNGGEGGGKRSLSGNGDERHFRASVDNGMLGARPEQARRDTRGKNP